MKLCELLWNIANGLYLVRNDGIWVWVENPLYDEFSAPYCETLLENIPTIHTCDDD